MPMRFHLPDLCVPPFVSFVNPLTLQSGVHKGHEEKTRRTRRNLELLRLTERRFALSILIA